MDTQHSGHKGKGQKDKQHSGHKERDRTNNTVATRKGTEGQTTQWPQGKGQKDKQRSTDHYTHTHTHKIRSSNTHPTKTQG